MVALKPASIRSLKIPPPTVKTTTGCVSGVFFRPQNSARYLNPQTGLWLSTDPAMGEYVPQAPINDDVRKQNQSLPGMGGVFNVVNLHVYHYAGNNPVKYVDPDGMATWVPLTYEALWHIAFASGAVDPNSDYGPNNNVVGLAFEKAVGQIFRLNKNGKLFSSSVRTSKVNPDFVRSSTALVLDKNFKVSVVTFPNGNFIEAKTSRIVINSGSSDNQIFSMIDALSMERSSDGTKKAVDVYAAHLYLVTPAGTQISEDIISYAKSKHVEVFQFTAEYDRDNPNQIRLSSGKLLTGQGALLAPTKTGTLDF
jgi:hypothetical protein